MTQSTKDPEEINQEEDTLEVAKPSIPPQKISRFGHQGPSKFGQSANTFNNPIQKGRPGRAAARGR